MPRRMGPGPSRCALGRDDMELFCSGQRFDLTGKIPMHLSITHLSPIVSIIAGVLILIMPRLLNFIVAIYLILIGIIGLGLIR
jgi:hypothetical protein